MHVRIGAFELKNETHIGKYMEARVVFPVEQ